MEGFKNMIREQALRSMSEEAQSAHGVAERMLNQGKIDPSYTLEERDPEGFDESRRKLNTEAGLVIANHPGFFDVFLILKAIERNDIKIVVSESNFDFVSGAIGDKHLIKASSDPREALDFVRGIKKHVEEGGLVILFPTAGTDRADKKEPIFAFQNGLSVILKRCLKPTDMVYTFYVDPSAIKDLSQEKISRIDSAALALATNPILNVNNFKDRKTIQVDERYTTAEEWLKQDDLAEYFKTCYNRTHVE